MTENIAVLTHSSIRIKDAGLTIYIDPFKVEGDPKDGDLILITHDHFDHFSPEDIVKIAKTDAILVVPEKMAKKAQEAADMVGEIKTVSPGRSYEIEGLKFETVPAYNMLKPFHVKWFDVSHISHLRVCHDSCRIGIDQDDLISEASECLAGLRA